MIITKLTFHNFGVYAGNNVFEFESSKPVVLIGGMNGRGKTTFLEGVLLALYGANSFAYSESKYSSYGQYLKAFVNTADGSLETYVELEFKLENETDERYLIRRSWPGNGQRTRETVQIKKDQVHTKELKILRERKNQTEVALQIINDRIAETSAQIEEARKKLEKTKVEYTSKGGDIVVQRQDLFTKRTALVAKVEQGKETLIGVAASELPLLLVKDLLEDISVQAAKEHETKLLGYTVDKIHSMFETYSDGGDSNSVRDFISYVENKAAEESTEIVFDISDQSFYQLTSLLGNGLMNAQGNMLQTMATCQKGIAKIDEIDSYLSVDIDEKVLSKIYKKIKTLEQEIIEHEASLEIAQKQRTELNGDVMRATSEYNRFVENMLSNLESDDDNGRILKYAHYATQALAEYKIRLQKKKIGTLAETMTKCYKQLANKKNLISRIDMDAVTLDFVYLNADNQIVPKESLSAGEKQLMVISLLWALAICSKKKLPVIIDTPLSRMDSVHRVALIKTYFPNASDQTIILSTDSEIDKHYYEIMKDTVGDEFTLVYDDELKCSKIKKGYFLGD